MARSSEHSPHRYRAETVRLKSDLVISIFGPTGVGKTELAVELARRLRDHDEDPVAVSADALQVYEGLDALAGKPDAEQLRQLEHRLVSFVPIEETFSVAEFAELTHREIDALLEQRRRPILVGGTGLYLRAALAELDLKPPPEPGLREQIERELSQRGTKELHGELSEAVARLVNPSDRKRIVRAVELERMGERPYGDSDQLWSKDLRKPTVLFGLVMERDLLAERIAARVDRMLGGGAIEEVALALERGASRTARKALGFKEIEAHLNGKTGLEQAAALIKRRHRQYVNRQLTWMRKLAGIELIDRTGLNAAEVAQTMTGRLADPPA